MIKVIDNSYAVILAGGKGTRMGNVDLPKQYLEIGSKAIIIHTIEQFVKSEDIYKVIVVCPEKWIDYTRNLIKEEGLSVDDIPVLAGGDTRNETLMNAIRYIEETDGLSEDTIIVTHDSVRPFVTQRIISENIELCRRSGACTTAIGAVDTIAIGKAGQYIGQIPDRKDMYQVQTPQTFRAIRLREHYNSLSEEQRAVLTDATKICVIKGDEVSLVKGEEFNIKITYPYDLMIAETIYNNFEQLSGGERLEI